MRHLPPVEARQKILNDRKREIERDRRMEARTEFSLGLQYEPKLKLNSAFETEWTNFGKMSFSNLFSNAFFGQKVFLIKSALF